MANDFGNVTLLFEIFEQNHSFISFLYDFTAIRNDYKLESVFGLIMKHKYFLSFEDLVRGDI